MSMGGNFPAVSRKLWLLLAAACLLWATPSTAEDSWIITHSERETWMAYTAAEAVRDRTERPTQVLRARNGWLAIVIGPFARGDANAVMNKLKRRGTIPEDSRVVGSDCCLEVVERPLGLPAFLGDPIQPPEQRIAFWSLIPELSSWSQFGTAVEELSDAMAARAEEIGAPPHSYFFGSAMNEWHAIEHRCLTLSLLLEIEEGTSAFAQDYPSPLASVDGRELRLAAHSLNNLSYIVKNLLPQGEDRWKHTWNLGCSEREEMARPIYLEPGADTFYDVQDSVLRLLGDVEDGFAAKAVAALDANPDIDTVALGSGGGYINEALNLGREIRDRGLTTTLYDDCMSACTLVFLSGSERLVWSPYPRLGFHMAAVSGVEVHPEHFVYEDIRRYADDVGVSGLEVVGLMMRAGAATMHYPELEVLHRIGVITWCQRMMC